MDVLICHLLFNIPYAKQLKADSAWSLQGLRIDWIASPEPSLEEHHFYTPFGEYTKELL